jgi:hypothetical protein
MDPTDFCTVAKHLLDGEPDEARCRSATSRAYYAAYNTAVAFLKRLLGDPDPPRVKGKAVDGYHSYTSACLKNSGNHQVRLTGQHLSALFALRKKADYTLNEPESNHTKKTAEATILQAERIMNSLNSVSPSGTEFAEMREAVSRWKQERIEQYGQRK